MKNNLLYIICSITFLTSCTKNDQKLVNDIQGKWTVTSGFSKYRNISTNNDTMIQFTNLPDSISPVGSNIIFNDCKIKSGDDCTGLSVKKDGSQLGFIYSVNTEATKITTIDTVSTDVFEILEREKNLLVVSTSSISNGNEINLNMTLEKE